MQLLMASRQSVDACSFDSDRGNLDQHVVGQGRDLNGCAGWFRIGEKALIDSIHGCKIVHIHQVDVYRNNIFHLEASGLDNLIDIFEHCQGLGNEAAGRELAALISSLRARNIKCVTHNDPVAMGRVC